jgi:hypothetical protein
MTAYVKTIIYVTVAAWAIFLLASGQHISSDMLRPLSTVSSVVVLLCIAFELWLWKLPLFRGWLAKRPVVEGTWRAELRSDWKDATGATIPSIEAYVVIRQTLLSLSLRLMTKESSSHLVGTEIVCSTDGVYCVSGVYRNEPRYLDRNHSPIHFGAVWLQVIDTPIQMIEGHYWTDRKTAGEMRLPEYSILELNPPLLEAHVPLPDPFISRHCVKSDLRLVELRHRFDNFIPARPITCREQTDILFSHLLRGDGIEGQPIVRSLHGISVNHWPRINARQDFLQSSLCIIHPLFLHGVIENTIRLLEHLHKRNAPWLLRARASDQNHHCPGLCLNATLGFGYFFDLSSSRSMSELTVPR